MSFVFFGTPDYVVPILELVAKSYILSAVVTTPPKPVGRDKRLQYSSVDSWAHKHKVPIFHSPSDPKIPEGDFGILASYYALVPESTIAHFKYGILNVHPSLLPALRGASPVQAALALGLEETGVSIMKLTKRMDAGDVVSSFKHEITPSDSMEELRSTLFARSAPFLTDLLPAYFSGKIRPKRQDEALASYTTQLTRDDGFIPWDIFQSALAGTGSSFEIPLRFADNARIPATPKSIARLHRALSPWPGIWTLAPVTVNSTLRLKLLEVSEDNGSLVPRLVQLEGKKSVSWDQFKRGYPLLVPKD